MKRKGESNAKWRHCRRNWGDHCLPYLKNEVLFCIENVGYVGQFLRFVLFAVLNVQNLSKIALLRETNARLYFVCLLLSYLLCYRACCQTSVRPAHALPLNLYAESFSLFVLFQIKHKNLFTYNDMCPKLACRKRDAVFSSMDVNEGHENFAKLCNFISLHRN